MQGFLQNFRAHDLLIEVNDATVRTFILKKAIEIAMLGLADECNAILRVLAERGQFDSAKASLEYECIWVYSGLLPPDINDAGDGTVWVPSEEDIRQKMIEARTALCNLPMWLEWNHFDTDSMEHMRSVAETSRKDAYASSWSGWAAMRTSEQYAAVIFMASDLDRPDVITELMPLMARRIHANQQAHVLSLIPRVWKDYLLDGWLREQLSLTRDSVQQYAAYVQNVARQRFEHGPRRPEDVFPDSTISQLLSVINENTVSSTGYVQAARDGEANVEGTASDVGDAASLPHSILHPGVTSEQIASAEDRLTQNLPNDLSNFFKLSNGCDPVSDGEEFYSLSLPPLDQLYFEKEDYMADYPFEIVPNLPWELDVDWPGTLGGGIAMYEHDGQGTVYVWLLGSEDIARSKEQLQIAYDKANADDRATIDRYIRYWYGDRQTYDAMTDHCYFEARWGEGASAVYPNFKSFLAMIACRSRHFIESSPLTVTYDI